MYTQSILFRMLSPELLDHFLSRGWYRMGQTLFTCRFVIFDGVLYDAVWIRLPLEGYDFRRGLRRRMRRIEARYHVVVGHRAEVDDVHERLYQRYRANFRGNLAATLGASLYDDTELDLFDTREVAIYDGDRLVAFSYFDVGEESIESVIGVYDPDYARDSLGFYTLLAEIRHGLERGFRYFYPGYVVPGYPALDYKLRIGATEFYDPRRQAWRDQARLVDQPLPSVELRRRLERMRLHLAELGVPARLLLYPPYEAAAFGGGFETLLAHPMVLACPPQPRAGRWLTIGYDAERDAYVLERCVRELDVSHHFPSLLEATPPTDCCLELLRIEERLAVSPSPRPIALAIIADQAALGRRPGAMPSARSARGDRGPRRGPDGR